jgi:iron complex outermembrane receptor protein
VKTSLIALAACLAAAPAIAQGGNQKPPEADAIIVTGERKLDSQAEVAGRLGLTVRETPASVDIVTQRDFQSEGARTAIEAMNGAPGLVSGNLPGSIGSVSMRGFHRAVNYLYDGVRMANSDVGLRNWDSWAFERIEVIKGPASVTSGEGALAGAINFVPRRPKLEGFSGEALASFGSVDTARLAGDVNVPLGRAVAARANASWSRSAGWIDDTGSRTFAASASLLLKPNEMVSLTLSCDYFEDAFSTAYYGTPVVARSAARNPSSVVSGSAGLVLDRAMRRINFDVTDGDVNSRSLWLRARAEYQLSNALSLFSDTSWYTSDRLWRAADEYAFNAGTGRIGRSTSLITHDHQFWNQRLHLAFDGIVAGLHSRVTAGLEFGGTDFFTKRRFGTAPSVDLFDPVRGTFPADTPAYFSTRQDVTAEVGQRAFFAEVAFDLTSDLLVVGGIRLDDIVLDRRVVAVNTGATQTYGQDYDPFTWRVGAVYGVARDVQLYAQHTRAVTPVGGFLFMSAANASYRLTTGRSWEGGVKAGLASNRVQLTVSLFDIRQDDLLTRDPADPAIVFQGGSLRSTGGELSLHWAPTDEIAVAASGTVLDARLVNLIEPGGLDRSGNRPPNVPERIADLVVSWSPRKLPLTLSGSVRHNGDFYTANANTVKVAAFTTVDAAIAWNAPFGTLTLRGRNLTDALYADWSGYAAGLVFVGAPRSTELSFSTRF